MQEIKILFRAVAESLFYEIYFQFLFLRENPITTTGTRAAIFDDCRPRGFPRIRTLKPLGAMLCRDVGRVSEGPLAGQQ